MSERSRKTPARGRADEAEAAEPRLKLVTATA